MDDDLKQFREKLERGELEVWSCDPADIPPWTDEAKERLTQALAKIFGWTNNEDKT